MGPIGPRWAPCWPHESCYQGYALDPCFAMFCCCPVMDNFTHNFFQIFYCGWSNTTWVEAPEIKLEICGKIDHLCSGRIDTVIALKSSATKPCAYFMRDIMFADRLATQEATISAAMALTYTDSKLHGANMGPIRGRQDPGRPHVGSMNLAIWVHLLEYPGLSNRCYL